MTVPPALAGSITWLRALRCGAFFIEARYPGKGRHMKNIIKCMIVTAEDEEKEIADMLRNDLYVTGQIENEATAGESDEDIWELTPAEELSMKISFELAFIAADSFSEMVDGMEIELIESIIRRLKFSDYKTAVRMLQTMFVLVVRALFLSVFTNCVNIFCKKSRFLRLRTIMPLTRLLF